jgi:hypothetical protein
MVSPRFSITAVTVVLLPLAFSFGCAGGAHHYANQAEPRSAHGMIDILPVSPEPQAQPVVTKVHHVSKPVTPQGDKARKQIPIKINLVPAVPAQVTAIQPTPVRIATGTKVTQPKSPAKPKGPWASVNPPKRHPRPSTPAPATVPSQEVPVAVGPDPNAAEAPAPADPVPTEDPASTAPAPDPGITPESQATPTTQDSSASAPQPPAAAAPPTQVDPPKQEAPAVAEQPQAAQTPAAAPAPAPEPPAPEPQAPPSPQVEPDPAPAPQEQNVDQPAEDAAVDTGPDETSDDVPTEQGGDIVDDSPPQGKPHKV